MEGPLSCVEVAARRGAKRRTQTRRQSVAYV
jgi:hypothetical protein